MAVLPQDQDADVPDGTGSHQVLSVRGQGGVTSAVLPTEQYKGSVVTEQASEALDWSPERFKTWRDHMDWSMSQAAAALGVTKPTIVAFENGSTKIDRRTSLACTAFQMALWLDENKGLALQAAPATGLAAEGFDSVTAKMRAVDAMPTRGRPRKTPEVQGMSEQQMKDMGIIPQHAALAGALRVTPPTLETSGAHLMNTRSYRYVSAHRTNPNCEGRVESYCNHFPENGFAGTDFYRAQIVHKEFGHTIAKSEAFKEFSDAENWLEENGPENSSLHRE